MEQFNVDKWLQDKSRKVVTRDGRDVEIVKYNMKGTHFPVLYVISNEDGSQEPCECSKSGMCQFDNTQSSTDLFFADEEEKLTEFEKEVKELMNSCCNEIGEADITDEWTKETASNLFDLARKEILKSLPKWKKAHEHKEFPLHVCVMDENMYPFLDTEVNEDEYYIELENLKTLPK